MAWVDQAQCSNHGEAFENMAFAFVFHKYLATELLKKGSIVSNS
jgi:hypothetical protein